MEERGRGRTVGKRSEVGHDQIDEGGSGLDGAERGKWWGREEMEVDLSEDIGE